MIKLSTATSGFVINTCVIKLKGNVACIDCHWDWTNGSRSCLEGRLISGCNIHKTSISRTDIRNIETTSANLWKSELWQLGIHTCIKVSHASCPEKMDSQPNSSWRNNPFTHSNTTFKLIRLLGASTVTWQYYDLNEIGWIAQSGGVSFSSFKSN